jgi:hypothetical protein
MTYRRLGLRRFGLGLGIRLRRGEIATRMRGGECEARRVDGGTNGGGGNGSELM